MTSSVEKELRKAWAVYLESYQKGSDNAKKIDELRKEVANLIGHADWTSDEVKVLVIRTEISKLSMMSRLHNMEAKLAWYKKIEELLGDVEVKWTPIACKVAGKWEFYKQPSLP